MGYVKNLAERHLERYGKKHKIVINRPSMIVHCSKEPFVGWTDTVSACGIVAFPLWMGMMQSIYLPDGPRDMITADLVSNAIIVTTAYTAQQPYPLFKIYHNASSVQNQTHWHAFLTSGLEYLKFSPYEKQVRAPRHEIVQNKKLAEMKAYLQEDLPASLTQKYA